MATIDGKDIYKTWGIVLLKDSFNSLFKYPKRKAINYTNYAERDGIVADLRKFETEPKTVSLIFFFKTDFESAFYDIYNRFLSDMNDFGYRTMDFGTGMVHQLRYDKTQNYSSPKLFYNNVEKFGRFTMNFIEDTPAINSGIIPSGGIPLKGLYTVDGVDFGDFGVHQDGEIGEILKYPDVKPPFDDGRSYHLDARIISHKEVTIKLWMHADSQSEFVRNYQAFYNAFAKPGLRRLYIKEINGTTEAYYTDCSSYTINWGNSVGAKFSIKLVIPVVTWASGAVNIYTVLGDIQLGLLADENGNVIVLN